MQLSDGMGSGYGLSSMHNTMPTGSKVTVDLYVLTYQSVVNMDPQNQPYRNTTAPHMPSQHY